MASSNSRFAPYPQESRSQLQQKKKVHNKETFSKWRHEYIKDSQHSNQDSLPSSQLPSLTSIVVPRQKQLFVLMDTCSLIGHPADFIDFVTNLRISFRGSECPIRFIIPLVVVEELNGKSHKRRQAFKRIIEEELRTFQIIVPDLDPSKEYSLPNDSLSPSISDNRILDSCLRSRRFIESLPHHEETKIILVTEDINFKTKATTFQVASFRWCEFKSKYHDFGMKNSVETPLLPSKENTCSAKNTDNGITSFGAITPKLQPTNDRVKLKPLHPFSSSQESARLSNQSDASRQTTTSELGKLLPTKARKRQKGNSGQNKDIRTMLKVKPLDDADPSHSSDNPQGDQGARSGPDEIMIIKEVITVD